MLAIMWQQLTSDRLLGNNSRAEIRSGNTKFSRICWNVWQNKIYFDELFLSDTSPIIASSCHSVTDVVENWLMWLWQVKIPSQNLLMLLLLLMLMLRNVLMTVNIFKLDFGQYYEIANWSRFQSWSLVDIWKLKFAYVCIWRCSLVFIWVWSFVDVLKLDLHLQFGFITSVLTWEQSLSSAVPLAMFYSKNHPQIFHTHTFKSGPHAPNQPFYHKKQLTGILM